MSNKIEQRAFSELLVPERAKNAYLQIQKASGILLVISIVALIVIHVYANPFSSAALLTPHLVLFFTPATLTLISLITFIISSCHSGKTFPQKIVNIPNYLPDSVKETPQITQTTDQRGDDDFDAQPIRQLSDSSQTANDNSTDQPNDPLPPIDDEPLIDPSFSIDLPLEKESKEEIVTKLDLDGAFEKLLNPIFDQAQELLINIAHANCLAVDQKSLDPTEKSFFITLIDRLKLTMKQMLANDYSIPKGLLLEVLKKTSTNSLHRRMLMAYHNGYYTEAGKLAQQYQAITKNFDIKDIILLFSNLAKQKPTDRDYAQFFNQLKEALKAHLIRDPDIEKVEDDIVYASTIQLIDQLFSDEALQPLLKSKIEAIVKKPIHENELRNGVRELLSSLFEEGYKQPHHKVAFQKITDKVVEAALLRGVDALPDEIRKIFSRGLNMVIRGLDLLKIYFKNENIDFEMYANFFASESFEFWQDNDLNAQLLQLQFKINKKRPAEERIALVKIEKTEKVQAYLNALQESKKPSNFHEIENNAIAELKENPFFKQCFQLSTHTFEQLQKLVPKDKLPKDEWIIALPCPLNTHFLTSLHNLATSTVKGAIINGFKDTLLNNRVKALNFLKNFDFIKTVLDEYLYFFKNYLPKQQALEFEKLVDDFLASPILPPIFNLLFNFGNPFQKRFLKIIERSFTTMVENLKKEANNPELSLSKFTFTLVGSKKSKGLLGQLSEQFASITGQEQDLA